MVQLTIQRVNETVPCGALSLGPGIYTGSCLDVNPGASCQVYCAQGFSPSRSEAQTQFNCPENNRDAERPPSGVPPDCLRCPAGNYFSSGGCVDCDAGFAGPHCEYSDATTCHGHGRAAFDGSCVCSAIGFDPATKCASCKSRIAGDVCDRCALNWYQGAFPSCGVQACSSTHSYGQDQDTGHCLCPAAAASRSKRCNCCCRGAN